MVSATVDLEPRPGTLGVRPEYTLNETPVYCSTPCTHTHTHTSSVKVGLRFSITSSPTGMCFGRKPTQSLGEPVKLHTGSNPGSGSTLRTPELWGGNAQLMVSTYAQIHSTSTYQVAKPPGHFIRYAYQWHWHGVVYCASTSGSGRAVWLGF